MKLLMASVFILGAVGVTSCKKDPVNPESPKIEFEYDGQKELKTLTLNVPAEGTEDPGINIIVNANYEWKIKESDIAEGITISPKTAKKGETTVNVKVNAFDDGREVSIEFGLVDKVRTATLTIKQAKKGQPVEGEVLYFEDAGTNPSAADGNPNVADFTNWSRKSPAGLDQSAVTYSGDASVRPTGPNSSVEGFSGQPNIFMNSDNAVKREFVIGNINVGNNTKLIFKAAGVVSVYPDYVPKTPELIEFYAGYDGENWAQLEVVTDDVTGYSWVSSEFSVKSGTSKVFIKIVTKNHQIRWDDLTLATGGNGSLIEPEVEPYEEVHKSIAEVRAHYKGGATAPVNGWWIEGVVVSDKAGANVQAYQIAVVDGEAINSGVMVNYKRNETNPAFNVGDKVKVILTNATYNPYFELLQLADVLAADVTLMNAGTTVTPITITPAQLVTGNYESMLVAIDDVEIIDKTPGLKMDGNIPVKSGSTEFVMRTGSSATFKGEAAPVGKGTLIGLGSVYTADGNTDYQVLPRTMADVEDMQDATVKQFGVTPNTPQSVGASAGTLTFNVIGNVAWTVTSTDNTNFGVAPASGDGAGEVTLTYTENTDTENTREATITFTTTDTGIAEGDRVITVTVTQAKAGAVGPVNLLVNPSFESVTGGNPDSWTTVANTYAIVTGGAKDGTNALKLTGTPDPSGTRADLKQTITGITAGKTYVVSFWYKDNTNFNNKGEDADTRTGIRIWSAFKDSDGKNIEAEYAKLQPSTYLSAVSTWTEYSVEVVAPAGATNFNFEVRAMKGNTGTIDHCSFIEK